MIDQLLDLLKQQPKEILQRIVLELMKNGKLSFTDIATTHVEYLEMLKKGESDMLNTLRAKVVELWCGTKKELPSKLVLQMKDT